MVILLQQKNFGPNVVYYASKWHPRGVPKASRASKMSPAASRRRPRASKKRPGGAKLDLVVFYSVFKRPRSQGGMRAEALITYRLGRLTELNLHIYPTSLHILENQPWSYTHWCARGHGADLIEGGQRP